MIFSRRCRKPAVVNLNIVLLLVSLVDGQSGQSRHKSFLKKKRKQQDSENYQSKEQAKCSWLPSFFKNVPKRLFCQMVQRQKHHPVLNYSLLQWVYFFLQHMHVIVSFTALMDEPQELKSYRFFRLVPCYFSSLFRLPPVLLTRRMKVGLGTVRAMECGLPQPCHFDRVNTLWEIMETFYSARAGIKRAFLLIHQHWLLYSPWPGKSMGALLLTKTLLNRR